MTDQPEPRKPCRGCGHRSATRRAAMRIRNVTRNPCLRCVEKHLGAAFVLMAEELDGYANYLRIVGHLHEAGDESQAWQALHDAIRVARHNYQTSRTVPDIEAIGKLIEAIHDGNDE